MFDKLCFLKVIIWYLAVFTEFLHFYFNEIVLFLIFAIENLIT